MVGIKYYKSTGNTAEMQPVVRRRTIANVIVLTYGAIREEGELSSQELKQRFEQQTYIHGYSRKSLERFHPQVVDALSRQGLLRILTRDQWIREMGYSNTVQYNNVRRWLQSSGIFPSKAVLLRIGEYRSDDVPLKQAVEDALTDILGDHKAEQFVDWYTEDVEERSELQRKSRIEEKAASFRQQKRSRLRTHSDFDAAMLIYDNSKNVEGAILERLVKDYSRRYPEAMKQYPFNLYFAISKKDSRVQIREGLDGLMQSIPKGRRFAGFTEYENAVFRHFNTSLEGLARRITPYFERGFREYEGRLEMLRKNSIEIKPKMLKRKIRSVRKSLILIKKRYIGKRMRDLGDIGQERGITSEGVRYTEARGFAFLKQQRAIRELLSYDFWDIPRLAIENFEKLPNSQNSLREL